MNALAFAVLLAAAAPPSPTPPPVIEHIDVNGVCSAVRENVAQTIVGLRVDDGIISQGRIIMAQIAHDAVVDPTSESAVGGTSGTSELDDVRLGHLVHALAQNLERIEALLNDPQRFPEHPSTDDERALARVKSSLEAVAAEQRRALQILSGTLDANELDDIASRCDPADCGATSDSVGGPRSVGRPPAPPLRLSATQVLDVELGYEQQIENLVTNPVVDVVNRCRASH